MGNLRLSLGSGFKLSAKAQPINVFLMIGQSNMGAHGKMASVRGSGNYAPLGPAGASPDGIAGYQKTGATGQANEWIGVAATSRTSGIIYDYPNDTNAPCLYVENGDNQTTYYDAWGTHLKQRPNPSTGVLADVASYGPELSFYYRHRAAYPTTPLAIIKCAVGGTGLASNWMPANTGSNTTSSDKDCFAMMKAMIQQATARLNGAGQAWRWAGAVWYQGEAGAHTSGAIPANDNQYYSDSIAFYAATRALTRANLPIVIMRIGDNWGWGNVGDPFDTTGANPFMIASGYPWAAIDYSINNTDGRIAQNQTSRNNCLAGARLRRATQAALGQTANCTMVSTDGGPVRPPFWPQFNTYWGTAVNNELDAYHWAHPQILANGENAFTAYQTIKN